MNIIEIADKQGDEVGAARYRRLRDEAKDSDARAAHELQQFKPLIDMVVADIGHKRFGLFKRKSKPSKELESILQGLEEGDSGAIPFVTAIRRMFDGERDYDKLSVELDSTTAMIVKAILEGLG